MIDNIVGLEKPKGGIMSSESEQIAKEQGEKANHITKLNSWLEKKGYDYEVINYSACGFKGSKEDNTRLVKTVKFMANGLEEYVKENL